RNAASAQLVVVNHALLLADLALQEDAGRGFLPKFERVVIDEAHHLEDAATGASTDRVTALAIRRALLPLRDGKSRTGALSKLVEKHAGDRSLLPPTQRDQLVDRVSAAHSALDVVSTGAQVAMTQIADLVVADGDPKRITTAFSESPQWSQDLVPM